MSCEEHECHRAERVCFGCHKPGHFTQNCPESNNRATTSKVTNQTINIDLGNVESLQEPSEETQQPLGGINLGMMEPTDEWVPEQLNEYTPIPWEIGDPLSTCAVQRLADRVPYPGNNPYRLIHPSSDRFLVYQITGGFHVVYDSEHYWDSNGGAAMIETCTLMDPDFRIHRRYWTCCGMMMQGHSGWVARQE